MQSKTHIRQMVGYRDMAKKDLLDELHRLQLENNRLRILCENHNERIENKDNYETLLQDIINLLPIRVFWKDENLKYAGCNKIFAKDAGENEPEDIIGKNDYQLSWYDHSEQYRADDRNVMDTGKPKMNFEEEQTTPSGSKIWLRTSKVPLTDQFGNSIGVLGTYEDITEQKKAEAMMQKNMELLIEKEKADISEQITKDFIIELSNEKEKVLQSASDLKKANDKLRVSNEELFKAKIKAEKNEIHLNTILEQTMDGISLASMDGDFIFVNQALCMMLGYSVNELLTMNVSDLSTLDSTESNSFTKTKKEGNASWSNVKLRCKDGSIIYVDINGKRIEIENQQTMLGVIRNVTERVASEQTSKKLQTAIESSKTSIIITDINGNIEYANPYFTIQTGYLPDEYIGKNPKILKSGLHTAGYYKNIWDTILSGNTWEGEFYNRKRNGEYYWENATISPILNSDNEIISLVAVKIDITETKKIHFDLIKSKEKSEESDKLKTSFLSNMSHEVRTPLNAIVGFTELLSEIEIDTSRIKDFVSIIKESSDRLVGIITDIIEISKIQTNQIKLTLSKIQLYTFISEIVATYKKRAEAKDLSLLIELNFDKHFEIISDDLKLRRIINHLVDNAIKFTNKGMVRIICSVNCDNLQIEVRDTGIGIVEEMQQIIFDPFRQAEIGATRNFGGNGLGLSIVKAYIILFNGKIALESQIDKGSIFSISIPLNIKSETLSNEKNEKYKKIAKTVLIVEDEYLNYLYLVELIKPYNFNIIYAENGKKAIDHIRIYKIIDLVFMDIKMPIMDGYTAAGYIRQLCPYLPIIALSAYTLDDEIAKYIDRFDDYITKPIDSKGFYKKLSRYV